MMGLADPETASFIPARVLSYRSNYFNFNKAVRAFRNTASGSLRNGNKAAFRQTSKEAKPGVVLRFCHSFYSSLV